jgi:hypothetical protein
MCLGLQTEVLLVPYNVFVFQNTKPLEKTWKVNSKSSVHSHQERHKKQINENLSSMYEDSDAVSEKSGTRHVRPRRRSSEYLSWYRTHHGGQGPIDERTGLYHDRPGAVDVLPCSYMKRSEDGACSHSEVNGTTDYEKGSHHERDRSPLFERSVQDEKASSPHCNGKRSSSHFAESCSYNEHYDSSDPTDDQLHSQNKKVGSHHEKSSPSDNMSGSPEERSSSRHEKVKRSGSHRRKPSPLTLGDKSGSHHEYHSDCDSCHLPFVSSQDSDYKSHSSSCQKRYESDQSSNYIDKHHSREKRSESSLGQRSCSHRQNMQKSRFNSGICHGTLTLPGKTGHSPFVRDSPSPSIDGSQTSSVSTM